MSPVTIIPVYTLVFRGARTKRKYRLEADVAVEIDPEEIPHVDKASFVVDRSGLMAKIGKKEPAIQDFILPADRLGRTFKLRRFAPVTRMRIQERLDSGETAGLFTELVRAGIAGWLAAPEVACCKVEVTPLSFGALPAVTSESMRTLDAQQVVDIAAELLRINIPKQEARK